MKRRVINIVPLLVLVTGCVPYQGGAVGGTVEKPEGPEPPKPHIVVEAETTRAIQGVSVVERRRYFNLCDAGSGFDTRVRPEIYHELIGELDASFGRRLGGISFWAGKTQEDARRPGFADLSPLKGLRPTDPSERFLKDCGPNLDVAWHGNHNGYPAYMGKHFKGTSNYHGTPEWLPENTAAAAELAAAVLKYTYTDFDRPAFFEPLNEPHWEFWSDPHLVDWHLATMEAVHREAPGVRVGGPCLSVAYFYRDNYRLWLGMKDFMDRTGGQMDFYSFHAYDFFNWRDGDFRGRMQSGLPLEGVLDLVQNYAVNTFGAEKDLVLSEHGGYVLGGNGMYDGEAEAAELARVHFPGDSFDLEMKKRSIVNALMLQAVVANTLVFMDHPHGVRKAVPFLLPESWSWDRKYYAQLFVPYDYTDETRPVPTHLLNFFRFFRDVEGRRVKALCSDPDLQVRAFVSGSRLFLIVNNLSPEPETVSLKGIHAEEVGIRRLGRNADFSGRYTEETTALPEALDVGGLEAVMLIAGFSGPVEEEDFVNEVVCYGDRVTVPLTEAEFRISVPVEKEIDYAVLRIGLTRSPGLRRDPVVLLNGKPLEVPLEDCADRLEDKEYATTKLVALDPAELLAENTVRISFPDGGDGSVGSVVIRAAVKQRP
jgi:hypothetical protein